MSETVLGLWLARQEHPVPLGGPGRHQGRQSRRLPTGRPPAQRAPDRAAPGSLGSFDWDSERIDLCYLHQFDPATPLEETLAAIGGAMAAGKIASFGVSNAAADQLRSVLALADERVRGSFTHVQNEFNFLERRDLADVIPLCVQSGLSYVAFSPLAGRLLTGKYRFDEAPDPDSRLAKGAQRYDLLTPPALARIEALQGGCPRTSGRCPPPPCASFWIRRAWPR